MKEMKFYTQEEVEDLLIGKKGTPERDRYEEQLDLFLIGDAIKLAYRKPKYQGLKMVRT